MSNTGRKIYQWLYEINTTTGLPTGNRKPNVIGDPDYIEPVIDYVSCPVVTWQGANPYCVMELSCPVGYTLSPDQTTCVPNTGTAISVAPKLLKTGKKAFANRIRLVAGIPDGFIEPNTEIGGVGDYVPPVTDLTACPI